MRRHPFQRRPPSREIGRKVVIACEGSKTEPGYFEGIRIALRLPTVQVVVIADKGADPLRVVNAALAERERQERKQTWTMEDCAWAVFDGEEHRANDPANWKEALRSAERNGIRLAISNPCFELWYLLHFQDHTAERTRDQVRQLLKRHLRDYDKANRLYPDPLAEFTQNAIERARQLMARIERDGLPPHSNPCTGVAALVESLLALRQET